MTAFLWYENQKDNLGFEFELNLDEGFRRIENNPSAFQRHYDNVHIHFVDHFPYGMHYLIDGDIVKVFGVFHTSRDPNRWKESFE